jgi:hypothetical protein
MPVVDAGLDDPQSCCMNAVVSSYKTAPAKKKHPGRGPGERAPYGGRGCGACGSHNTEGLGSTGVQWCHACNHRWTPCRPGCRGFECVLKPLPKLKGCGGCGVPDHVAQQWPEAWRQMAKRLDVLKRAELEA